MYNSTVLPDNFGFMCYYKEGSGLCSESSSMYVSSQKETSKMMVQQLILQYMIEFIDGKLIKINEFKCEQDRLGIGLYRYS